MNEIMDLQFYNQIKEILTAARSKVYSAANFAMVEAYWHIGKNIVEKQGGEARAEYGAQLIKALSEQMTIFLVAFCRTASDFVETIPCIGFCQDVTNK